MNTKPTSWAFLTTGWGKNAKDIIDHCFSVKKCPFKISLLIYAQDDCGAAESAKKYGLDAVQIKRTDYENAMQYQEQIINVLKRKTIDYIFLLNYKYLIRKDLLNAYPERILNVHPSLFPSFLGTKTAIQDALDYGVKITGITTHVIDDEYDKGNILLQKAIRIRKNDTFDSLYPQFSKKGKKLILKTMRLIEKDYKNKRNSF
ncbi:phosphoribosylglycinamide formyltransferase [Flavobacteriaceae bacterium F89]|uniref:phosphoribosylglycinamide formyltransferase 1 n=1 Tax=Cerina litoralis TaxID=2874477 RepID=A0AAE3EX50_9FLAO|nr:formyltransferase family protein [Cerina litoralis]MCG2461196.1 phosphoribosylglycinamide formyltransferase [Cerina litoralis]